MEYLGTLLWLLISTYHRCQTCATEDKASWKELHSRNKAGMSIHVSIHNALVNCLYRSHSISCLCHRWRQHCQEMPSCAPLSHPLCLFNAGGCDPPASAVWGSTAASAPPHSSVLSPIPRPLPLASAAWGSAAASVTPHSSPDPTAIVPLTPCAMPCFEVWAALWMLVWPADTL